MGRGQLPAAFYTPALAALRLTSVLMEFEARVNARRKAPVAMIGVAMRSLVHIIYDGLKSTRPIDAVRTVPA